MRNNMSRTENGALTHSTSGNHAMDLFFNFGAARGNTAKLADTFFRASQDNPQLARRIALWGRDARGGAGEREAFRAVLKSLDRAETITPAMLEAFSAVGRADDLFVIERNFDAMAAFYKAQIEQSALSGLFAKWAPRQGPLANKLRKAWGFTSPKAYRKFVVERTNVVEQLMCAKKWNKVEYPGVPSVAMARYNKAFVRNDAIRFDQFRKALENGTAKINASAIFPHDIVRTGRGPGANVGVIEAQWQALPDFIANGKGILPMCDVSGSMGCKISGSISAMDVSIALGLYISERQQGAFKDMVLTFSSSPQFHKITGSNIVERIKNLECADWGMSTNIEAAFMSIIDLAVMNDVPAEDMPEYLVILSDMEFDIASRNQTNFDAARTAFEKAGYKMPQVVFWNLNSRTKNVPVSIRADGVALVSGFSPSVMKAVLAADRLDPVSIMEDTVNVPRYDVPGWTV